MGIINRTRELGQTLTKPIRAEVTRAKGVYLYGRCKTCRGLAYSHTSQGV